MGTLHTRLGLVFVAVAATAVSLPALAKDDNRAIEFPDVAPYKTLVVDLHTHSVFSDGMVWPVIRVGEATRDGLDLMAITEHLEYQPRAEDIPHPDRNRSFAVATESAAKDSPELMVVNGAEITRSMPPGHVNAVFIKDANAMRVEDPEAAVAVANEQGGFVFWNHPYWARQRPDGIATLTDMHRRMIAKKHMHGIEVANGASYSDEALQIALDNDLVILGVSDIHGLIDWDYDIHGGGHRTTTLVFARERSPQSVLEALREKRTVAWFNNTLVGRTEPLLALVKACLTVRKATYQPETTLASVTIENTSDVEFLLATRSAYTYYTDTQLLKVPAHSSVDVHVKTKDKLQAFDLVFDVLNAINAPKQNLQVTLPVSVSVTP